MSASSDSDDSENSGEYVSQWQKLKQDLNRTSYAADHAAARIFSTSRPRTNSPRSKPPQTAFKGGALTRETHTGDLPLHLLPILPSAFAAGSLPDASETSDDEPAKCLEETAVAARAFLAKLEAKTAKSSIGSDSLDRHGANAPEDLSNSLSAEDEDAVDMIGVGNNDMSKVVVTNAKASVRGTPSAQHGQKPGIISEILKRLGQPPLLGVEDDSNKMQQTAMQTSRANHDYALLTPEDKAAAETEAKGIVEAWWGVEREAMNIRKKNQIKQRLEGPRPQKPASKKSREIGRPSSTRSRRPTSARPRPAYTKERDKTLGQSINSVSRRRKGQGSRGQGSSEARRRRGHESKTHQDLRIGFT